jgi:hypothetical protein
MKAAWRAIPSIRKDKEYVRMQIAEMTAVPVSD